jgi:hypothetical protein
LARQEWTEGGAVLRREHCTRSGETFGRRHRQHFDPVTRRTLPLSTSHCHSFTLGDRCLLLLLPLPPPLPLLLLRLSPPPPLLASGGAPTPPACVAG